MFVLSLYLVVFLQNIGRDKKPASKLSFSKRSALSNKKGKEKEREIDKQVKQRKKRQIQKEVEYIDKEKKK